MSQPTRCLGVTGGLPHGRQLLLAYIRIRSSFKHFDKGLSRDLNVGNALHPFFALGLPFQELHATGDIAAVLHDQEKRFTTVLKQ